MALLYILLQSMLPRTINLIFGKLQLVSSGYMGFSHGSNDAQKTMGILALALFTATSTGQFDHLPAWLHWLRTPKFEIAPWIKILCALTMASGTAAGGWRIIRTMGHKMVRLQPIHGFAAETTSASVLMVAAQMGMPVSTTHAISTSIMGVGAAKTPKALRWELVERIVWAWVLTLPATGAISYLCVRLVQSAKPGS